MEIKRENKSEKSLTALLLCMLLATAAFISGTVTVAQGAEVNEVTRYAPASHASGAEFEVKLTITGELPLVVGIVETIPEGFRFVSTMCEDYEVSGQDIAFVVVNEKEITYRVTAPSSGEGTFSGTWIDMLSDKEGNITDTTTPPVTTPKPNPTATPAATPRSEVPGFEAIFTAIALLITCLLVCMWGGKEEGGSVE
ncbi:MAG: hypothetical protein JW878_04770 [Methanomicrobia archaeon]|nr:hypothetical protein [Methanomicrobia archaeon]